MEAIETIKRESGLIIRISYDDSGTVDSPLYRDDEGVRFIEYDGVYAFDSWKGKRQTSRFSEPEEVLKWAKENRFICYPVHRFSHGPQVYFKCWPIIQNRYDGYLLLSRKEWPRKSKKSDSYAKATLEEHSAWRNGEVYGYEVTDSTGKLLDSCWGFIGDLAYCTSEAKAQAEAIELETSQKKIRRLKAMVKNRVPLSKRESALTNC